jgi:oxygen-independent coproporphyrinogen III oxidase
MKAQKEYQKLIEKYNVPGPRYTSYPTVPHWDNNLFSSFRWLENVGEAFKKYNREGISLYIHLPFCESLCTYCGCNTRITVNHQVEYPYIKTLLKEWDLYRESFNGRPLIRELHLGGGTPTFFKAENLKKLLEAIFSSSVIAPDAEFSFEGHPNNTKEEHLKVLSELGFTRVSYGIQDFDRKVQETVNRIQSFETVKRVTELSRELGFTSINFDLIYGLPFQTLESVRNTVGKVSELMPDRIAFYSYAHVPWIKPGQRKFTEMDLPADEEKRKLYELGRMMFEDIGYKEIGMDHFALPSDSLYKAMEKKSLHRNFMGYTSAHTNMLIGLGASSISDTWNAFAQNVKSVEEYSSIIAKGILPVFKGHFLSREDEIIRKHILNLMCNMQTSWSNGIYQTESFYEGLKRMKEMEGDGLVEIRENSLQVLENGRPFLRNVCMALDPRMWKESSGKQLFSKTI